jgi:L-fuculose-phosphate aldolase
MRRMLSVEDAGEGILHVARRMYERGYVAANDGNVSVRLSNDRLLTTPTGMSKGFLSRSDLVVTDMSGQKVSGKRQPTSEIKMHLKAYELRQDVGAVVHAHPPYATAFAVAGIPLVECLLPEVIVSIGSVPLAHYGTPSTEEVPRSIESVVTECDAFLLRNHGVMTVGPDVLNAYHKLETVEHFAQISFIARHLGSVSPLTHQDVEKLLQMRERLGVTGAYPGCEESGVCAVPQETDQSRLIRIITEEVIRILREGKDALD